jgi:hypothetical protein
VLVNRTRENPRATVADLFPTWARSCHFVESPQDRDREFLRHTLEALPTQLEREESLLLAAIIADLAHPATLGDVEELTPYPEPLQVGTCPLAERYFLEITDGFVRRKGRVNVLVSQHDQPILLEKLNLGDDHSCISVTESVLNGVRLPAGSLFGVHYDGEVAQRANRQLPGPIIPISTCGFRFLRLTTLAISPANRKRAFTTDFEAQVQAPLFAPGQATVEQLREVAQAQL